MILITTILQLFKDLTFDMPSLDREDRRDIIERKSKASFHANQWRPTVINSD